MRVCYQQKTHEPAMNLAIEEALVHAATEDLFMLWMDDPCIVVGRNQNARKEIDPDFIARRRIPVVRRLSGGGAVYHDHGNLCFTYIELDAKNRQGDHARYTAPVIAALKRLGVPAELQGRNDIVADGKKISGNAQYVYKDKMCHHGTLLFDVDMQALDGALRADIDAVKGRGIASRGARVTNIISYLPNYTADTLAEALCADMLKHMPGAKLYDIPEIIWQKAESIANARYRNWDWCFGQSPPYGYAKEARFPGGRISLTLSVENGIIQDALIQGDFLSTTDITPMLSALRGIRHDREAVGAALSALETSGMLGAVTTDELLSLV